MDANDWTESWQEEFISHYDNIEENLNNNKNWKGWEGTKSFQIREKDKLFLTYHTDMEINTIISQLRENIEEKLNKKKEPLQIIHYYYGVGKTRKGNQHCHILFVLNRTANFGSANKFHLTNKKQIIKGHYEACRNLANSKWYLAFHEENNVDISGLLSPKEIDVKKESLILNKLYEQYKIFLETTSKEKAFKNTLNFFTNTYQNRSVQLSFMKRELGALIEVKETGSSGLDLTEQVKNYLLENRISYEEKLNFKTLINLNKRLFIESVTIDILYKTLALLDYNPEKVLIITTADQFKKAIQQNENAFDELVFVFYQYNDGTAYKGRLNVKLSLFFESKDRFINTSKNEDVFLKQSIPTILVLTEETVEEYQKKVKIDFTNFGLLNGKKNVFNNCNINFIDINIDTVGITINRKNEEE